MAAAIGFQSTRPHGARPPVGLSIKSLGSFNPRARTGRDTKVESGRRGAEVSIHAPARGATIYW